MTDETGRTYLDLVQGWAVNSLGHSHPAVVQALTEQARMLVSASPAFYNRPALRLAELLSQVSGFDRVFLGSTGAEANEGAVKLARRWGQKFKGGAFEVITFDNAFHGRTLAMMSASGKPGWDGIFAPMPQGFVKARFNDVGSVESLIGPHTAAVMIEPVQGEAGVQVADAQFLRDLRSLATKHRVLLVFDEVQTGIGRCGTAFAFQHYGVEPDIVTLAKGIGGGVPLSAVLCRDALDCFNAGDQGGTYSGNPLMAAVGLAVVQTVCTPGFLAEVRERGAQLSAGLQAVSSQFQLGAERGVGLLRALPLPLPVAGQVVEAAMRLQPQGLLLNAPRANLLRFMPALTIHASEVDAGLKLLKQAFAAVPELGSRIVN
jgi:acetylornithine/N-succinyldiaminopimelate aminotransferase